MKYFKYLASTLAAGMVAQGVQAQSFYKQQSSASYAGLYLSVPLGGDSKRSSDQLKFGFRAGLQRDLYGGFNGYQTQQRFSADMVRIDFTQQGFNQLSFAGRTMLQTDMYGRVRYLGLDGEEADEDKGSGLGTVLMWGGVIMGGLLIVGTLGSCVDGVPKEDSFLDFCPLN